LRPPQSPRRCTYRTWLLGTKILKLRRNIEEINFPYGALEGF
jgi:hypothetical protein